MSLSLEELSIEYAKLIGKVASSRPCHQALFDFIQGKQLRESDLTRLVLITFSNLQDENGKEAAQANFKSFQGIDELNEEVGRNDAPANQCRLFVIENLAPKIMCLLGGRFDIDTQFFADHFNLPSWRRLDDIACKVSALTSAQKEHDFLHIKYSQPRTIRELERVSSTTEPEKSISRADTSKIRRGAGVLNPRSRKGQRFNMVLFVRQAATVYFKRDGLENSAWVGIFLVDGEFRSPSQGYDLMPPEYRIFSDRPHLKHPSDDAPRCGSTLDDIKYHLHRRVEENPSLVSTIIRNPFLILADFYKMVASNWMSINKYVNRELETLEYILEKERVNFLELEEYLKDLYIHRRRCVKHLRAIRELKEQCHTRGQRSWPADPEPTSETLNLAQDLQDDFSDLQGRFQETQDRTDKNLNLLTALISIGEGKQSLEESHGVGRLTLLATIFLPFSTIATIFSMQGDYAPRANKFWIYWVVAICVTAVLATIFFGGGMIRRYVLSPATTKVKAALRAKKKIPQVECVRV